MAERAPARPVPEPSATVPLAVGPGGQAVVRSGRRFGEWSRRAKPAAAPAPSAGTAALPTVSAATRAAEAPAAPSARRRVATPRSARARSARLGLQAQHDASSLAAAVRKPLEG